MHNINYDNNSGLNNNTDTTTNAMGNKRNDDMKFGNIWLAIPTRHRVIHILGPVNYKYITSNVKEEKK